MFPLSMGEIVETKQNQNFIAFNLIYFMDNLNKARSMYFRDSIKSIFLTNQFIQKIQRKKISKIFQLVQKQKQKNSNTPMMNSKIIKRKILFK